jgi:hypothetical protein
MKTCPNPYPLFHFLNETDISHANPQNHIWQNFRLRETIVIWEDIKNR